MRIQFVTGIHGNEKMPVLALASLGVDQIVANPLALSQSKRFVEKDMNASFGTKGKSLEEIRARKVMKLISKGKTVIDLHSFSTVSDPFTIIVDMKMKDFAVTLGFKHVVYMKHNIKKGHSLIDYTNGVSVEVGNHDDPNSFILTRDLANKVKTTKLVKEKKVRLYEVYGIIDKHGKYKNFSKHKDGFYPVLAGENAYDHFGLKAKLIGEY